MLADVGSAVLASTAGRYVVTDWQTLEIPIVTPSYRPPDVFMGSCDLGADLDMWSLGCVAAELFLRQPLFQAHFSEDRGCISPHSFLDEHCAFLGAPPNDSFTHAWLRSLPFAERIGKLHEKRKNAKVPQKHQSIQGCPPMLKDFVHQVLKWHPQERLSAASASLHSFVTSPPLSVSLGLVVGKHGLGTLISGDLDDGLLDYLQKCPTWESLHQECKKCKFDANPALERRKRSCA